MAPDLDRAQYAGIATHIAFVAPDRVLEAKDSRQIR
jgi:hypothetical protein